MNGRVGFLESHGLTNKHTEDYGIVCTGKRTEYSAYCDSSWCVGVEKAQLGHLALKKVIDETEKCPDCGRMLIYKRKRNSRETG